MQEINHHAYLKTFHCRMRCLLYGSSRSMCELREVFGPGQIPYIPEHLDTVEKVALASYRDFPTKKGWDYIDAARSFIAKTFFREIKRQGNIIIAQGKF